MTSLTITDELSPSSLGGQYTPVFSDSMVKGSTSDGVTTWALETIASDVGTHRYYATATLADSDRIVTLERPTYEVTAP